MYRILIIDDQESIRTMLLDFLEEKYEVHTCASAKEALCLCNTVVFDMVISDINMPGMKGPELLKEIKQINPRTKTMLITAYDIDEYVRMALDYGVSNIIPKTAPFNFAEFEALVYALLTENIFGLNRYMLKDAKVLKNFCIHSSAEARNIRDEIISLFVQNFGTSGEMKLILDEIITNAIYHAPALPDGTEKYPEFSTVFLQPDEYVHIECGFDSEKYGVSITDYKGRLKKEVVLTKILRQINGEGVLDDSGRGIHMSRLFSDRMIINIKKNIRTEVILMNYFSNKYKGYKPLYINEL